MAKKENFQSRSFKDKYAGQSCKQSLEAQRPNITKLEPSQFKDKFKKTPPY